MKIVIDATNATLGRLCSYVAKQLLLGHEVHIVNCNDAIIAGRPVSIVEEFHKNRVRRSSSLKGPFYPKVPERIVKRTVRGMLPYKKERGSEALHRLKCYNKTPAEFKEEKKILAGKEKKTKTITLKQLSDKI
jgi:large subunit ribosomal protein L13